MDQQPQWVGIDVSKASLDVYLRPNCQQFQVPHHASGVVALIQQLHPFKIQQVILYQFSKTPLQIELRELSLFL